MTLVRFLFATALTWTVSFGTILAMHYYVPPLLREQISLILLVSIVVAFLYEWLRKRNEKIRTMNALTTGFVRQ